MNRTVAIALITFALSLALVGCNQVNQVPDDQFAASIENLAKTGSEYGLKLAIDKKPEKAEQIVKDAKIAVDVIKTTIVPTFSGAATGDVLRSAVETALTQLNEKISPEIRAAIQLVLGIVSTQVTLPANPADKIPERTRLALAGFFKGLAAGLEAGSTASRDLAPPTLAWPAK